MSDQREMWDAEAACFDEAADHGLRDTAVRGAWQMLLEELLPAAPARVVDLGCGTGTLSLLMAEMGHTVVGVDFSPAMLERARAKATGRPQLSFRLGDADTPDLAAGAYDVVLSRHVLWAMADPAATLERWAELLAPGGRLVLIEGRWSTGAGMCCEDVCAVVTALGRPVQSRAIDDPALWGRVISDERYVVLSAV